MDSGDRGTVRFVPEDFDTAIAVLQGMSVHYEVADVLLVEMPNQAGAFRKVCEKLAGEHLNIDYAYCSFATGKGTRTGVLAVVRVNDLAKAQRVLGESPTAAAHTSRRPGRRPVYAR
jgi:hypothetical protein